VATSPNGSATSVPSGNTSETTGAGSSTVGGPTMPGQGTTGDGASGDEASGCACRLTSQSDRGQAASSLLGLGLAFWMRRRRARA
jgi:MYXO-CTERM domain-containing protein